MKRLLLLAVVPNLTVFVAMRTGLSHSKESFYKGTALHQKLKVGFPSAITLSESGKRCSFAPPFTQLIRCLLNPFLCSLYRDPSSSLEYSLLQHADRRSSESLIGTRDICTKAVPWLNDNRGPEILAAITIMTFLATAGVVLRCLVRRAGNLRFGWDDWLIFVAMAVAYGLTILQYYGTLGDV